MEPLYAQLHLVNKQFGKKSSEANLGGTLVGLKASH